MTKRIVRTIARNGGDFVLISDALREFIKEPPKTPVTLVIRTG